jgi:hypothetical protein
MVAERGDPCTPINMRPECGLASHLFYGDARQNKTLLTMNLKALRAVMLQCATLSHIIFRA